MRIFCGKGFSYHFCNQSLPTFYAKHLFENLKYCLAGFGWWVDYVLCVEQKARKWVGRGYRKQTINSYSPYIALVR